MLCPMTMFAQRGWVAALAAAMLASTSAAGVRAEPEPSVLPPEQPPPAPARTVTTHIVSTEGAGTVTAAPSGPAAPSAPPPAQPGASPEGGQDTSGSSSEPPAPTEYDQSADTDPAALEDFREPLAPYGTWEDDPNYGTVWLPSSVVVGADFAPYVTNGHWGLTASSSWLWVSDFSWGWAPFHYGRWVWIGGRGWAWIPGGVYSPAWVVWRTGYYGDYYVGWAPMPPTWYWYGGWAVHAHYVHPAPYVFCPSAHVFAPYVRPYLATPGQVGAIGARTRPYIAATPGVFSTAHSAINMTRGPTMADAHVPVSSIPAQRATPDSRVGSFAQARPQTRPSASTQSGPFAGRGGLYDRSPGSSYASRSLGQQNYPSRSFSAAAPARPAMPALSPSSPIAPSTPRPHSYAPSPAMPQVSRPTPGPGFAYSAPARPSMPVVRPSMPAAPVVRPSAPPSVNMVRPSAPSVSPSRPAAAPRSFSR